MHRRRFLGALAAGVAAVSGCLSSDPDGAGDRTDPGDADPTPTPPTDHRTTPPTDTGPGTPTPPDSSPGSPTDPPTDAPGNPPTAGEFVTDAFAAPELAAPNSPDSLGVYGERGEQYVVAVLDPGTASAPALDDITLTVDGDAYPARTDVAYGGYALFDAGSAYDPADREAGWVVFRLQKPIDAGTVVLNWPGAERELDPAIAEELARPPTTFAVESFEAPERAKPGDTVTATLTVRNTGDVDGTFVAALNRVGPLVAYAPEAGVRLPVPAGETATWTYERTLRDESFPEDRPMELKLRWRDGELTRDVTVESTSTDTDAGTGTATDS